MRTAEDKYPLGIRPNMCPYTHYLEDKLIDKSIKKKNIFNKIFKKIIHNFVKI